jgi:miniconductance mechanosensitive channel
MMLALAAWAQTTIGVTGVIVIAVASYALVRRVVMPLLRRGIRKTSFKWDDVLLNPKLLHRISLLAPFLVIWLSVHSLPDLASTWPEIFGELIGQTFWIGPLLNLNQAILVVLVVLVISSGLTAINELYSTFPISRQRPIKGYLQIVNIIVWIFGVVILLAVVTNQEIGYFVTGLGAMTAILLLIFKDTILSLVASVQLTQNDMIRVGDWVEVPGQNADGDIIDIALHTVTIQNFDKTVTTVPTHTLIES